MSDQQGQHPQQPAPDQPKPGYTGPQQPPAPQPPQPQPAPDNREWVQVPQQTSSVQPQPEAPSSGKGLAVTSMALGLIALLSSLVFGFYFNLFVFAAALIGLAAVVLGIVALVKRSRPKAAGITGLATGATSIIVALVLGTLGAIALTANLLGGIAGGSQGQGQAGPDDSESWTPDAQPEALLEWPSNMASGGIVFSGPGDPLPLPSTPLQPGTSPVPHQVDRAQTNDVLIYVDYRCPHCMMFEQTNGALLQSAVESGDTTVEIVPLSFLDRASEGSYYSSRAAGAMACVVDSQPEGAWRAHQALLLPEVQPGAGPGLTNAQLVAVVDAAVGGISPSTRDCIESERFVTFAQALNKWVFANPVPNASDQDARLTGTPSVFVNGVFYDGPTDDSAAFEAFLTGQFN